MIAYVVRIYPDPGSQRLQHHKLPQMRLASHGRLKLLQQLRSLTQAPAGYPKNLPPLLQPNPRESELLPGMWTETERKLEAFATIFVVMCEVFDVSAYP